MYHSMKWCGAWSFPHLRSASNQPRGATISGRCGDIPTSGDSLNNEKGCILIVVRRTYVPNPGTGGRLLALVKQASDEMANAGFGKPRILRTAFGDHGTLITEQPWDSLADYDASRDRVRATSAITKVFDQIYPLLAATHNTEVLIEVD